MSAPTRNSASSKQPEQMMEIEIKFAKGKVDFVIVHFGDDAISLAKVSLLFLCHSNLSFYVSFSIHQ